MKKWKQIIMSLAVMAGVVGVMVPASQASAVDVFRQCAGNNSSAVCKASGSDDLGKMVKTIINTILVVIGMISVIMIVVGGFRYTTSNGDSAAIKTAKDTILYSVVGLVVAIMSFSIVNFVVGRF
jgi:type IV secretion system pilin